MKYAINKIIFMVLHLVTIQATSILTVGCSSDFADVPEASDGPEGVPTLDVTVSIGNTRSGGRIPEDFEAGTGYENYLDIKNGNFRIYFFDAQNKYLATFKPTQNTYPSSPNATDLTYKFSGKIPAAVNVQNSFKLVVLANWGSDHYPLEPTDAAATEEKLRLAAGSTTIEDLTTHTTAQFLRLSSPEDDEEWLSDSRLIPFYGVREYNLSGNASLTDKLDENGRLTEDVHIELTEELPLLRAMAKVEVILNNAFASFSKVELTRANAKGFCSPYKADTSWAFNFTDYFPEDKYDWANNFFRGVHLTHGATSENKGSGMNDSDPSVITFKRANYRTESDNVVKPEKWVAYVPEYKNIGVTDFTTIRVTLADPDPGSSSQWTDPTKYIYFAKNGCTEEANETQSNRFDIERNNIYRFTVEGMTTTLNCEVDIIPYSKCKLEYEYPNIIRDKAGDIKLSDNEGKIYDFCKDSFTEDRMPKAVDKDGNPITGSDGNSVFLDLNIMSETYGDYYARVENNGKAEIWLKNKFGDHVLSNFATSGMGCHAHLVKEANYPESVTEKVTYSDKAVYKDIDGDIRIMHFSNHSSIVVDNETQLDKYNDYNYKNYTYEFEEPISKNKFRVCYKTKSFDAEGNPMQTVKKYPISSDNPDTNNDGIPDLFWYSRYDKTLKNPTIDDLYKIYNELRNDICGDETIVFPSLSKDEFKARLDEKGITNYENIHIINSWNVTDKGEVDMQMVAIQFNSKNVITPQVN